MESDGWSMKGGNLRAGRAVGASDEVPGCEARVLQRSKSLSASDGGCRIPGDPCNNGEPAKGRSSSAVGMRRERQPNMHSTRCKRPDGPSGAEGARSSSGGPVTEVEDDAGWPQRSLVLCSTSYFFGGGVAGLLNDF